MLFMPRSDIILTLVNSSSLDFCTVCNGVNGNGGSGFFGGSGAGVRAGDGLGRGSKVAVIVGARRREGCDMPTRWEALQSERRTSMF